MIWWDFRFCARLARIGLVFLLDRKQSVIFWLIACSCHGLSNLIHFTLTFAFSLHITVSILNVRRVCVNVCNEQIERRVRVLDSCLQKFWLRHRHQYTHKIYPIWWSFARVWVCRLISVRVCVCFGFMYSCDKNIAVPMYIAGAHKAKAILINSNCRFYGMFMVFLFPPHWLPHRALSLAHPSLAYERTCSIWLWTRDAQHTLACICVNE